jgi:hypothetical protein
MLDMAWNEDDEAVDALGELLESSYGRISHLMACLYPHAEAGNPNWSLVFTLGRFCSLYYNRRDAEPDETSRESFNAVLADLLSDPGVEKLFNHFVAQGVQA